ARGGGVVAPLEVGPGEDVAGGVGLAVAGVALEEAAEEVLGAAVLTGLEGGLAGPEERLARAGALRVLVDGGEEGGDGLGVAAGAEEPVGLHERDLARQRGVGGAEALGQRVGLARAVGVAEGGVGLAQHPGPLARVG